MTTAFGVLLWVEHGCVYLKKSYQWKEKYTKNPSYIFQGAEINPKISKDKKDIMDVLL